MAISTWTKHLKTDEEKAKYLESLKRVSWLLDHLKDMIIDSERSLESQEISPKSYDSPNWDYRQAHSNGYRQCLKDFKKLLTLDHEEKNGRQPNAGAIRTRRDQEQVERQATG